MEHQKVMCFLLPSVTNRKNTDCEILGFYKMHMHFTCIFLSCPDLFAVWSVSVINRCYCPLLLSLSGCCPVKKSGLAGVEPDSPAGTKIVMLTLAHAMAA